MAKAEKKTEVIKTTTVTLTMTEEEARTVRAILGHVAGDKDLSPRKHADALAKALDAAGVDGPTGSSEGRLIKRRDFYGQVQPQGVRFENYGNAAYTGRAWGSI